MSKYQAIRNVNEWRLKWNREKLPNYTPQKTIYYDKISKYLRRVGAINYNFAMGAYLFEINLYQVEELNELYISDPKKASVLYNEQRDTYTLNRVIANPLLRAQVLSNNRKDFDSFQADLYGWDEWYYQPNIRIENEALLQDFSKSGEKVFNNKIQLEAIRRYGSKLLPPKITF